MQRLFLIVIFEGAKSLHFIQKQDGVKALQLPGRCIQLLNAVIEISIFEKSSRKSLRIYLGIGILAIVALYLIFPKYGPFSLFLPIIVFLIILTITESKEKPVGTICLTERQIVIMTIHEDIILELFDIRKLKLNYSGYKGKRLPGDFMPRFNQFSGIDNFIGIDKGSELYEYRFLVEDEMKERQLVELISDWEKIGFDVSHISINI